jgi:hypothetical protein
VFIAFLSDSSDFNAIVIYHGDIIDVILFTAFLYKPSVDIKLIACDPQWRSWDFWRQRCVITVTSSNRNYEL